MLHIFTAEAVVWPPWENKLFFSAMAMGGDERERNKKWLRTCHRGSARSIQLYRNLSPSFSWPPSILPLLSSLLSMTFQFPETCRGQKASSERTVNFLNSISWVARETWPGSEVGGSQTSNMKDPWAWWHQRLNTTQTFSFCRQGYTCAEIVRKGGGILEGLRWVLCIKYFNPVLLESLYVHHQDF